MASHQIESKRLANESAKGDNKMQKVPLAAMVDGRPHPALANVTCSIDNGQITLEGVVPTFYLKQLAQETAVRIRDVQTVNNKIVVKHAHVGGG